MVVWWCLGVCVCVFCLWLGPSPGRSSMPPEVSGIVILYVTCQGFSFIETPSSNKNVRVRSKSSLFTTKRNLLPENALITPVRVASSQANGKRWDCACE